MNNEPLTLEKIYAAQKTISPYIPQTPLTRSFYLSGKYGLNVYLKMENLNLSGSFKIRGATNALLCADQEHIQQKGVLAISAGNHAQGVARTANILGVKATIFMPKQAPLVKIDSTRNLGAEVILAGESYDEAEKAASDWNKQHGAFLVHPFSDTNVIAGQATTALEICEQLKNEEIGAVVTPIGGGGLASGVACAIKSISPKTQVIGAQSQLFSSVKDRFTGSTQKREHHPGVASLADGIAVKGVSEFTYSLISEYVDSIEAAEEDEIAAAIMELMERDHILAEGAGAVSVAMLERLAPELKAALGNKPVVCIVSGGNIDVSLLNRITKKGLYHSGRIMRLSMSLPDRPGALVNLLKKISDTGANLYNIEHNRVFSGYGVKIVDVVVDLETSGLTHQDELITKLSDCGYEVTSQRSFSVH